MFENKFVLLFINFLWMVGLFGALLAFLYMNQYRRQHWWKIGYTHNVPRTQLALYASLVLFSLGLALHAYAAQRAVSLWVALVWGLLALFFLFRALELLFAGLHSGWDTVLVAQPLSAGQRISLWTSSVVALLVVNLLVLGWWGSAQLQAGALDLPWRAAAPTTTTASAPGLSPSAALSTLPAPERQDEQPLSPTVELPATLPATLAVLPTAMPAVSTLAANALVVTPTPVGAEALVASVVTPTLAVTATPLPTVPPASPIFLTVQSPAGANVRTTPDLTAAVITVLPVASVAPVLGRTADGQWYLIQLAEGAQGWIAAELILLNGDATD